MHEHTIYVPDTLQSDVEGYTFLASILPIVNQNLSKEDDLIVDFSRCSTLNGNLSAALGALLDKSLPLVKNVFITRPMNKTVNRTLARNHFFRAWQVETQIEEKENYVEYGKFRSDISAFQFKRYIQEGLINKQKFPQHTNLAGERIVESIFEIYVNAATHGDTDFVYSCGEYISDKHILEMTIVDCGRTIPGNVNDYLARKKLNGIGDCEAIEWAFISGNTTKSQTGGLGLAIIKEFIELNQGSIQVVSGFGFIEYREGSVERASLQIPFPGTIVNMKFNFDDNKKYYMKSEIQQIDKNDLL